MVLGMLLCRFCFFGSSVPSSFLKNPGREMGIVNTLTLTNKSIPEALLWVAFSLPAGERPDGQTWCVPPSPAVISYVLDPGSTNSLTILWPSSSTLHRN
jgi:hypothetical protein